MLDRSKLQTIGYAVAAFAVVFIALHVLGGGDGGHGSKVTVDSASAAPPGRAPDGAGGGPGGGASPAGGTGGAGGAGGAPGQPVSLSTATVEQLDALDGIGPTLAQRIVAYRQAHGGFRSVDELQQVPGIGDKRFAALRKLVQP